MTTEEIIRMARMAGIDSVQQYDSDTSPIVLIERFAALVASAAQAKEREACAKLCEKYTDDEGGKFIDHEGHGYECAAAIRARGQA